MKIDSIQADILAANKVNVSKGEWEREGTWSRGAAGTQTQARLSCFQYYTKVACPAATRPFILKLMTRISWITSHTSRRRIWRERSNGASEAIQKGPGGVSGSLGEGSWGHAHGDPTGPRWEAEGWAYL